MRVITSSTNGAAVTGEYPRCCHCSAVRVTVHEEEGGVEGKEINTYIQERTRDDCLKLGAPFLFGGRS